MFVKSIAACFAFGKRPRSFILPDLSKTSTISELVCKSFPSTSNSISHSAKLLVDFSSFSKLSEPGLGQLLLLFTPGEAVDTDGVIKDICDSSTTSSRSEERRVGKEC